MNFSELPIDSTLLRNITSKGYETATPIQAQAIPVILESKDLIGKAETGSGKTMAFLIPIIQKIVEFKNQNPKSRDTLALVLAPTRELAKQIIDEANSITKGLNVSMLSVYGGARINGQIDRLKRGVDLVVGCPGRVLDLTKRNCLPLGGLHTLILDEADQMLDMGFFEDIKKILAKTSAKKQTILFSATMPKEIMALTTQILTDPVEITVGDDRPKASIEHLFYEAAGRNKNDVLKEILGKIGSSSTIIFARTKNRANVLNDYLYDSGFSSTVLEGGMSPHARKRAWDGFKAKEIDILVATDIASRGLDASAITHVINFDMPNNFESYTHRIGRTGRYDKKGSAITLVAREDQYMIRTIRKNLNIEAIWEETSVPVTEGGRGRSGGSRHSSGRSDRGGDRGGSRGGYRGNSERSSERSDRPAMRSESRDSRPQRDAQPRYNSDRPERRDDSRGSRDSQPRFNSDRPARDSQPRENSERSFRKPTGDRPARQSSEYPGKPSGFKPRSESSNFKDSNSRRHNSSPSRDVPSDRPYAPRGGNFQRTNSDGAERAPSTGSRFRNGGSSSNDRSGRPSGRFQKSNSFGRNRNKY